MLLDSTRLTFDCVDPALLGHFWSAVTGYQVVTNEAALIRLQGAALGVSQLVFREVDRWKASPNRLQLDLLSDDLEADTQRLVALGASSAGDVGAQGERRRLLRDPEGNEFSLVEVPAAAVHPAGRRRPSRRAPPRSARRAGPRPGDGDGGGADGGDGGGGSLGGGGGEQMT